MTVSALLLVVLAALIGVVVWRPAFSVRRLGAGQPPTRRDPGRREPRGEPGGPRRPLLTVASEPAAIAGLLIAFIALVRQCWRRLPGGAISR